MADIIDIKRPAMRPVSDRPYAHAKAFCLMWYACECGHQERIWNSRDGVTPFRTLCPSCGSAGMQHERWNEDACEPNHRPRAGQRVWVAMTRPRAEEIVDHAISTCRRPIDVSRRQEMVDSVYRGGGAPDLVVWQSERGTPA